MVPAKQALSPPVLLLLLSLCGVAQTDHNASLLELNLADLQYSNLQGQGPHLGTPRGLRYRGVGWAGGTLLDLLVDSEDRYHPFDVSQNVNAGVGNEIGRVNIQVGTHVELTFRLVRTGTSTPQEVEEFHMTFVLADQRLELQVFDFADYCVSASTDLVHHLSRGMGSLSLWPTRPTLPESIVLLDPALAQDVMDRAVTFSFRHRSRFAAFAYAMGSLEEAGLNFLFAGTTYIPAWNCYRWRGKRKGGPTAAARAAHDCNSRHGPLRFRAAASGRTCAHVGMEAITDRETCKAAAEALRLSTTSPVCSQEAPSGCSVEMGRSGVSLYFSAAKAATTSSGSSLRRPLCKTQVWDDAKTAWCCKHKDVGCSQEKNPDSECSGTREEDAARVGMRNTSVPMPLARSMLGNQGVLDCDILVQQTAVPLELRSWCCRIQKVGCENMAQPSESGSSITGSSGSTSTTTAFVGTTTFTFPLCQGMPAGRRLTWSTEEQHWCCLHWGLGCMFAPEERSGACEPGEDCPTNPLPRSGLRPQRLFTGALPSALRTHEVGVCAGVVLGAFVLGTLLLTTGRLWRHRAYSALPTEDLTQMP